MSTIADGFVVHFRFQSLQHVPLWLSVVRIYVFGVRAELGGPSAIEWMSNFVDEAISYRKINPPTDIWSILKTDSASMERRGTSKAYCMLSWSLGYGRPRNGVLHRA